MITARKALDQGRDVFAVPARRTPHRAGQPTCSSPRGEAQAGPLRLGCVGGVCRPVPAQALQPAAPAGGSGCRPAWPRSRSCGRRTRRLCRSPGRNRPPFGGREGAGLPLLSAADSGPPWGRAAGHPPAAGRTQAHRRRAGGPDGDPRPAGEHRPDHPPGPGLFGRTSRPAFPRRRPFGPRPIKGVMTLWQKSDLVIVESPAKAKTIGKYLGPGYEVKASMGHVRDLPKSKIGVDVDHGFDPGLPAHQGQEEIIGELEKSRRKRAARSTWPPTRTGRGRPSPGTWPTCWAWTRTPPTG